MTTEALNRLLGAGLEDRLRDMNPWWRGDRPSGLPPMRRWAYERVLSDIRGKGLAPITVLRGPRQIGKTTLLNQVIEALLIDGVTPSRILRLQFDDIPEMRGVLSPVLDIASWYQDRVLGMSFNRAAQEGKTALLFLDEVQNVSDWAPQLKHLVDMNPVRVIVTGSSALRIEAGRDSLAGRISTLEMGPLLIREIGEMRDFGRLEPYLALNGLSPLKDKAFWIGLREFGEQHKAFRQRAFAAFSARGAYPIAQAKPDVPWEQMAEQLNETVIRRAIQHDLRMGARGQRRDEHLLEEVFRLACRYIGQSPTQALYLDEIRRVMHANIGWQRILTYLKFLDGTLLLRLIEPLELRLKRQRGASKLCLCDHALRAAWLREVIPLDPEQLDRQPHLMDLAGRIAESAVGYFFRSIISLGVAHFPERGAEPEVDFVITIGEQRIPVEVKYRRRIDYHDTRGLRAFIEKAPYNAPFGILVTMMDEPGTDDPRIVSLPVSSLLLMR